jgi:hypothetical protein
MALKKSQKSLLDWEKEDWGTKSGEPSAKTGERYLPKAALDVFKRFRIRSNYS